MLTLVVTNACNFICKTCLRRTGKQKNVENLSLDILKKTLKEVKRLGFVQLAITGGEPCLHPEFEELVALLARNGFSFGIVSNGSLLERYKFLAEKYKKNILYFTVSLDGATEEVHDAVRQPGSFKKAQETIRYFSFSGIGVQISMCINKVNQHQVEEIFSLTKELGVQKLIFTSAIRTPLNGSVVLSDKEKLECVKIIREKEKEGGLFIKMCRSLVSSNSVNFCASANSVSSLTINAKDEIVFCCDTIGDGTVVGSLKESSFADLYLKCLDLSSHLRKIRVKMLNEEKISEGFGTCEFCSQFLRGFIKEV